MISEAFSAGDSDLHRLDPRLKIVLACLGSAILAVSDAFWVLGLGIALAAVLVMIAHLPFRQVAKRLALVNGFVILLWLVLPLTYEGEILWRAGIFGLSRPGVLLAARLTLKSNAIVSMIMALLATSSMADIGYGLSRLRVPDKIVHLLLMTYRYIFVIEQEYERLHRAARVRCFRAGTNLHTYRTYAYLVGMLLVKASERARKVHQAMICRGFKGKFYTLRSFAFTRLDAVYALGGGAACTVLVVLEIWSRLYAV